MKQQGKAPLEKIDLPITAEAGTTGGRVGEQGRGVDTGAEKGQEEGNRGRKMGSNLAGTEEATPQVWPPPQLNHTRDYTYRGNKPTYAYVYDQLK